MLNLDALREAQEDLDSRSKQGLIFRQKSLKAENDFRIMPPEDDRLEGKYFIECVGYWINKHFLLAPIDGSEDFIQDILNEALEGGDADVEELLGPDVSTFSKKSYFYFPCWKINVIDEDNIEYKKFHIFESSIMLIKAINAVALNKVYQNKTKNGIFDLKKGYNVNLTKSGEKLNTEYGVVPYTYQTEVPQEAINEMPDWLTELEKLVPTYEKANEVIREYLYGEKPEAADTKKTAKAPAKKAAPAKKSSVMDALKKK